MNIVAGVVGMIVEGRELARAFGGSVEVELYERYLDLWWEWQFIVAPWLLEPVIGC